MYRNEIIVPTAAELALAERVEMEGTGLVRDIMLKSTKYSHEPWKEPLLKQNTDYLLHQLWSHQDRLSTGRNRYPNSFSGALHEQWNDLYQGVARITLQYFLEGHPHFQDMQLLHRNQIEEAIRLRYRGQTTDRINFKNRGFYVNGVSDNEFHALPDMLAISADGSAVQAVDFAINTAAIDPKFNAGILEGIATTFDCDYSREIMQRSLDLSADTAPTVLVGLRQRTEDQGALTYGRVIAAGILPLEEMTISVVGRIAGVMTTNRDDTVEDADFSVYGL